MKKLVLTLFALGLSLPTVLTAQSTQPTIPVDQIHAGMHGVAYTVFQGIKPEPMDVEVLGVLRNVNGPRGNIILIRLHGEKVEYTGVVAGMSGSPVYIDGKLAGALAFRIGEFSKEPIAGVTPIADMLEINAMDKSPAEEASAAKPAVTTTAGRTAAPGDGASLSTQTLANYLKPIDTPLVFNGFSEEAVRQFAPQFASAGIVPVMGAGSVSEEKQPEPLEAGSAVSAVLVRGDMDIAATCTVTYIDPQRLLACGHPLLQFGSVDLPMNKAQVLATLPSPLTLQEASYPAVQYIPRRDVVAARLKPSDTETYCPFKGDASYYHVVTEGGATVDDVIWTYEKPYPAVAAIAGHVAFYPDKADIEVA